MLREGELPPAPLPNGSAPNASALAARCDERIEWAASQGVAEYPELHGGLNSSSPRAAFQLHLHLYVPSSGCTDPRALLLPASLDAAVNFVVVLAVCLCAVCNACALGKGRRANVRAALRALGCLAAPTRPSYLGSTWAREEASLRGWPRCRRAFRRSRRRRRRSESGARRRRVAAVVAVIERAPS